MCSCACVLVVRCGMYVKCVVSYTCVACGLSCAVLTCTCKLACRTAHKSKFVCLVRATFAHCASVWLCVMIVCGVLCVQLCYYVCDKVNAVCAVCHHSCERFVRCARFNVCVVCRVRCAPHTTRTNTAHKIKHQTALTKPHQTAH
jgi:hypothetical protein